MNKITAARWSAALSLAWMLSALSLSCDPDIPPAPTAGVHGSVYAEAGVVDSATSNISGQVFLPDIEVSLFRFSDETVTATVKTDYFGRYYFPPQQPGIYQLRWAAQRGWAAGHHPDRIVIKDETRFPTPGQIEPEKGLGVVFGSVRFADGSTPWTSDELFAVNNTASVSLLNSSRTETLGGPTHANAMGIFAVPGLPPGQDLTIRAQNEASSVTRVVPAAQVFLNTPVPAIEVQLPNARPEIIDLVPIAGGSVVQTAAPGDTITISATTRDADGDSLTHRWDVLEGAGTVTGSGPAAQWTLPGQQGTHSAYLQVSDGRGGYALERLDFTTAATHVLFSGVARDKTTSAPIDQARVTVNGDVAATDKNGFFSVRSPIAERYVLNIEKTGYALFSRVVDAGLTGQTWHLVKTYTEQVDPSGPISVTDKRPQLERQHMKGMTVRVPANSLVDSAGNPPSGVLTAHLATLDIADAEAPGDWGARFRGRETNLISFGAGFVEFLDANGTTFNLRQGTIAEVEFTPPPSMATGAPATAPTWAYDPASGYWELNGRARFMAPSGTYVNEVEHFSTINTDIEKESAACLGVMIYPPIPTGVKLRVKDPSGTKFTQSFEFVLDAAINGVYRLPANTDVSLELLKADGTAYGAPVLLEETPGAPLPGNVVNTGAPIPSGQSLWPPEPYVPPCKLVVLREANEPTANAFLAFKTYEASEEKALAYYAAVDPNDSRKTLREWWETNGFEFADTNGNGVDDADFLAPPTNAIRTSYLNDNDLGSGRDMYFLKRSDGSVAAYVTNYGLFNQDHGNADLAANRTDPRATVCMEWSPVEGQGSTRIVKFFVYANGDNGPNAVRQTSADLDGFGPKFVPNLCNNCHGGSYFPTGAPIFSDIDMRANFRELDIATYKFPGGRLTANAAEKAAFRQQNEIVRGSDADSLSAKSIKTLIDGWYAGGTDDQDNDFTPAGFSGSPQNTLYLDVVRNSCRTCHVALGTDIDWTTYEQLEDRRFVLKNYVLCDSRVMPHAVITYRNFWLSSSPHRPASLRTFQDGANWAALGPCS